MDFQQRSLKVAGVSFGVIQRAMVNAVPDAFLELVVVILVAVNFQRQGFVESTINSGKPAA